MQRATIYGDTLDSGLKYFAFVGLLCFLTGVLLENAHLGRLGISDFSGLQPRLVLVGLSFYIYILTPLVPAIAAHYTYKRVMILTSTSRIGKPHQELIGVISGACSAIISFIILPISLHYFISDLWLRPMGLPMSIRFWSFYIHEWWWLTCGFLYIPSTLCILFPRRLRPWRTLIIPVICIGAIGSVMTYSYFMYRNIEYAVGGGRPQIIQLECDGIDLAITEVSPVASDTMSDPKRPSFALMDREQYYLLWHESEGWMYLTRFTRWQEHFPIIGIPKDRVVWHRRLPSTMYFGQISLERSFVLTNMPILSEITHQMSELLIETRLSSIASELSVLPIANADDLPVILKSVKSGLQLSESARKVFPGWVDFQGRSPLINCTMFADNVQNLGLLLFNYDPIVEIRITRDGEYVVFGEGGKIIAVYTTNVRDFSLGALVRRSKS